MFGKLRFSRWLVGVVVLAAVECAGVIAVELSISGPAQAQFRDDRYPVRRHSRPGGFFDQLFGGGYTSPRYERGDDSSRSAPQHVDHSHAPNPAKPDKDATPTTQILVMGDGMSDWLGYGLEDAFSDTPEIAIIRKDKQRSGLLRYDTKGDLDWWHAVRDILTKEKANYVVMMIGLNDRDSIREKDVAKEDEKQKAEKEQAKNAANKNSPDKKQSADQDQDIVAPEPKGAVNGVIEFRTALWAKVYSRRIDETIAALKSKGVPVFWVGLPSIRGTKSTADAVYLNDLFRTRAERAGINYIDVWDGFVDDSGKYSTYGPDYEGQTRKLRSADGVYFTKFGARKLAHYVEREIRRYMANRAPIALPSGPLMSTPDGGKSAARPVIGPVIPLTVNTGVSDQLLGAADSRPVYGDAIANDVLVKGESAHAQQGRADDFAWQPSSTAVRAVESQATTAYGATTTAVRQVGPASNGDAKPESGEIKSETEAKKPSAKNASPSKPAKDAAKTKADAAKAKAAKQTANATKPAPKKRSLLPAWLR
jgi:uncharacterized protein